MASPRHRSQGYSRKAQYSLFAAYMIAIGGALIGLLLVILSAADPVGFAALRTAGAELTAPIARVARMATGSIGSADESVSAYIRAGSQNRQLKRDLTAVRRELTEARALKIENEQLRNLLALKNASGNVIATARMLNAAVSSSRRTAVIDAGASDGVRSGQPVRSADGLIGRTLSVGPTIAHILLITDTQSIVPVRRASDGLPAQVAGRGDGLVEVRPLNVARNPLKPGDLVIASGVGGIYHAKTPVAVIISSERDVSLGKPLADPAKIDAVLVESAAAIDAPALPDAATPKPAKPGTPAANAAAATGAPTTAGVPR